jgi:hypothetical protein
VPLHHGCSAAGVAGGGGSAACAGFEMLDIVCFEPEAELDGEVGLYTSCNSVDP